MRQATERSENWDGLGVLEEIETIPHDIPLPGSHDDFATAIGLGACRVWRFRRNPSSAVCNCQAGDLLVYSRVGAWLVYQQRYGWFVQSQRDFITDFWEQDSILRNPEYCRVLNAIGIAGERVGGYGSGVFFMLRAVPALDIERGDVLLYNCGMSIDQPLEHSCRDLNPAGYKALKAVADEHRDGNLALFHSKYDDDNHGRNARSRYWVDISPWHKDRWRNAPMGTGRDRLLKFLEDGRGWGTRRKVFQPQVRIVRVPAPDNTAAAIADLLASIGHGATTEGDNGNV